MSLNYLFLLLFFILALTKWGVEATLPQLKGMFAFALWDAVEKKLILARDRFGEKPLYYDYISTALVFGSELKALFAHPDWTGELDAIAIAIAIAIADFLRFCYIPAPRCIVSNVRKLLPGHWITFCVNDVRSAHCPIPLRSAVASFIVKHTPAEIDQLFSRFQHVFPDKFQVRIPGDKLHKLAGVLREHQPKDIYRHRISATDHPSSLMLHPVNGTRDCVLFPDQEEMNLTEWKIQQCLHHLEFTHTHKLD